MDNIKDKKRFYNKKNNSWRKNNKSKNLKGASKQGSLSVNEIEKKFNSIFDKTISNLTQGLDDSERKKQVINQKNNNFKKHKNFNKNKSDLLMEFKRDFENYKQITDKKLDLIINYLKKIVEKKLV